MATNNSKPSDGHWCSGNWNNVPVTQDATGSPITSPITSAQSIKVPEFATVLYVLVNSASTQTTVQPRIDTTNQGGYVEVPNGVVVEFECAGMNGPNALFPNNFLITPGTSGRVSFWFGATTPGGA